MELRVVGAGVGRTGTPSLKLALEQLIDIMRFDGAGHIVEHWGVADMLMLMQQIGAVPGGPPV
jgi:hypothetical protein